MGVRDSGMHGHSMASAPMLIEFLLVANGRSAEVAGLLILIVAVEITGGRVVAHSGPSRKRAHLLQRGKRQDERNPSCQLLTDRPGVPAPVALNPIEDRDSSDRVDSPPVLCRGSDFSLGRACASASTFITVRASSYEEGDVLTSIASCSRRAAAWWCDRDTGMLLRARLGRLSPSKLSKDSRCSKVGEWLSYSAFASRESCTAYPGVMVRP